MLQPLLPFEPKLVLAPKGFSTKGNVDIDIVTADNMAIEAIQDRNKAKKLTESLSKDELGIETSVPSFTAPLVSEQDPTLSNYIADIVATGSLPKGLYKSLPETLKSKDQQIIAKSILAFVLQSPDNQRVGKTLNNQRGQGLINLLNGLKRLTWQPEPNSL